MNKRVLITGATGFLGSHLCDRFIKEGFSVIAMDNFITGSEENISHLYQNENFSFINHDVTEFSLPKERLYKKEHKDFSNYIKK